MNEQEAAVPRNDNVVGLPAKDQAQLGPRITDEHVEKVIASEWYDQVPGTTLTLCVLKLVNGFTVTGESACVSDGNFDAETGKRMARQQAKAKIWLLEGYVLRYALHAVEQVENIARVCHEVNRAYCRSLGDYSQVSWYEALDWQKQNARDGVAAYLCDRDRDPAKSHNDWMRHMAKQGWTYGPDNNAAAKTHPCMVPFKDMSVAQQAKDHIFRAVVLSMAFPLQA